MKRDGIVYFMKKSKDSEIKKKYSLEEKMKNSMIHMKGRNLMKVHKVYHDKSWMFVVYEFAGDNLSWEKVVNH